VFITTRRHFMKIYVGNLSFSTTGEQLREKFAEHGEVEEVTVVTDRDTGRAHGFGFVTMLNSEQAKAAIQALNSIELDGRALKVNEAQPHSDAGGPKRRRW
jgi:RNA recognition motif-containing protein